MRQLRPAVFVFFLLPAFGTAGDVGLVYESAEALLKGRSILGTVTGDGVVVSAQSVPVTSKTLLVGGIGKTLHKGSLARLDNELDVALIRLGELVDKPELQEAHKKKSAALLEFLPTDSTTTTSRHQGLAIPSDPFSFKINGDAVGTEPVVLRARNKESNVSLEVTRGEGKPVWNVSLRLVSDPPLRFWKKGKQKTLRDVPSAKFEYGRQFFMKPVGPGDSFTVPIEVSTIKGASYVWTLKVDSKSGSIERKFSVTFQ